MSNITFEEGGHESLLGEGDQPLFDIITRDQNGLIIGLHTGVAVPEKLRCVGRFNETSLFTQRHEAFDLGSREVLELVAESLGATSFISNYSRLVSDLNRDEATHITARLDCGDFEGNCGEIAYPNERLRDIFNPSRNAILSLINSIRPPFVLDIHSAYGTQGPENREFDIGVLHAGGELSRAAAERYIEILREQNPDLDIKENYPYHPTPENFGGIDIMAAKIEKETGIPTFLVELNQDQVGYCPDQQRKYADILANATKQLREEMMALDTSIDVQVDCSHHI